MLAVEMAARIRREFDVRGESIKQTARHRFGETDFPHERTVQPLPKLRPWSVDFERLLEADEGKQWRARLTLVGGSRPVLW